MTCYVIFAMRIYHDSQGQTTTESDAVDYTDNRFKLPHFLAGKTEKKLPWHTCKNTCIIAVGFPPPNLDILNIVSRHRIKKGKAKQSLRCQGDPADKALCRPQRHKIQYEIIVIHFRNPPKQNTDAVTKGRAPEKVEKRVEWDICNMTKTSFIIKISGFF